MRKQKVREKPEGETLCWKCSNCYGNCSWAASGIPVEGWKAERHDIIGGYTKDGRQMNAESYMVRECPEFVADPVDENRKFDSWKRMFDQVIKDLEEEA